jgi:hypothetical protein
MNDHIALAVVPALRQAQGERDKSFNQTLEKS